MKAVDLPMVKVIGIRRPIAMVEVRPGAAPIKVPVIVDAAIRVIPFGESSVHRASNIGSIELIQIMGKVYD
jgi:hypothetical protein